MPMGIKCPEADHEHTGRDCAAVGKANLFGEVKHLLSGDCQGGTYPEIASRLSMTESAVRVAVHRLRQRYGELLRAEIAQTVESEAEVEEELRCLRFRSMGMGKPTARFAPS